MVKYQVRSVIRFVCVQGVEPVGIIHRLLAEMYGAGVITETCVDMVHSFQYRLENVSDNGQIGDFQYVHYG
jgi:hypothetical protein